MQEQVDCRGIACPEPVMRCRKVIEEKHPAKLVVLVDNAAANENVGRLLSRSAYLVQSVREGSVWTLTGTAAASDAGNEVASCVVTEAVSFTDAARKTLLFITTETLGHGSDELGAKLMENFLATVPEMNIWRIVLLNGGVKLAASPGKALDSLKALEASGVSVLVCGTCLNFYGLLEAKAVGETTNMLDIVTSLELADKVVRP